MDQPNVSHKEPDEVAPTPSSDYALTKDELKELTMLAEKGDIKAMIRVADYYGIYLADSERSFYWLEMAANAGDAHTREFILGSYAASDSSEIRKRGEELGRRWAE